MNNQFLNTIIAIAEKGLNGAIDQDVKKAQVQKEVYGDGLKLRREALLFKDEFNKLGAEQKISLAFEFLAILESKFGIKEG